jgi:hypothetical protein
MRTPRPLIALSLTAVSAATLVPTGAAALSGSTSSGSTRAAPLEYMYPGHDSEKAHGIISTIQFIKQVNAPKVAMNPYYSWCGEFWTGWMRLHGNTFLYTRTFSNHYGIDLTGHFNASRTKATGHVRTWGPTCKTVNATFSAKKAPGTYNWLQ